MRSGVVVLLRVVGPEVRMDGRGNGRDLSGELRIYSGSSHPELAKEIADYLGCPVCPSTTGRYSNDNLFVRLEESVRGKDVVIIQSFAPGQNGRSLSDYVLELLMMLDAARSASAKTIHAVIPYYSYARSDKKDEPRISIAGRLIADLLATAGASHVMTMELHSPRARFFQRTDGSPDRTPRLCHAFWLP